MGRIVKSEVGRGGVGWGGVGHSEGMGRAG